MALLHKKYCYNNLVESNWKLNFESILLYVLDKNRPTKMHLCSSLYQIHNQFVRWAYQKIDCADALGSTIWREKRFNKDQAALSTTYDTRTSGLDAAAR